ncbi:hypothetical protein D3C73_543200 [compost metagenome]
MKLSTKLILSTGALCFTIGVVGLLNILQETDFEDGLSTVNIEKKIPATDTTKLSIRTDIAAVTFVKGNTDEIKVHMTGSVTAAQQQVARINTDKVGSTWKIEAISERRAFVTGLQLEDVKSWFVSNEKQLKVEVTLPPKILEEIKLESDTGSLNLGDIDAVILNASSDTGRITVGQFQGKQLNLESDTGRILVNKAQGSLQLSSSTGAIEVTQLDPQSSVNAETDVGSIRLDFTSAPLSTSFDLFTDVGHTSLNVPNVQIEKKERALIKATTGSGSAKIKARTSTGSIEIGVR